MTDPNNPYAPQPNPDHGGQAPNDGQQPSHNQPYGQPQQPYAQPQQPYAQPQYGQQPYGQPTQPGSNEPGAPGAPNPNYAAYGVSPGNPYQPVQPLGTPGGPASGLQRFLAAFIDGILLSIVAWVLSMIFRGEAIQNFLQVLIALGYYTYFNGQGQTVGKMVLKTKVVDAASGEPIGLQRAAIRGLLQVVFSFLVALPYLSIFLNPERRGWHDQAANDKVIYTG